MQNQKFICLIKPLECIQWDVVVTITMYTNTFLNELKFFWSYTSRPITEFWIEIEGTYLKLTTFPWIYGSS